MTFNPNDTVLPEYVAPGCSAPLGWDTVHGWRIDGAITKWWPTKATAKGGAKAIGWQMKNVTLVHTRFQVGYALSGSPGGLLTKEAYEQILNGTFTVDRGTR